MTSTKFKAVLFDLDGTLVDTAPDLAAALNHVLTTQNKKILDYTAIRPFASDGTKGLLKLGFNITDSEPKFFELRKIFIDYYMAHIADHSVLFAGMKEVLDLIENKKIPWGVVTNKMTDLATKLLQKLNLDTRSQCIIGGDSVKHPKPHPEPLLLAAELLNIDPKSCCYVGDAERDMEAAIAANMTTVFAAYGYLHKDLNLKNIKADYIIHSPEDLRNIL